MDVRKLNEAKIMLVHYFSVAGVQITSDTAAEIESIVDLIAEAVTDCQTIDDAESSQRRGVPDDR